MDILVGKGLDVIGIQIQVIQQVWPCKNLSPN